MSWSGWLLWLLAPPAFGAELTLAPVFTPHLVVQRDTPLPVWGRADPGAVVSGEFAGERQRTTADRTGRWRLRFGPQPASSDPASVHPRDKRTVASRLARLALAQVYGRNLLASGPHPQALRARGRELEVTLDSVGAGLATSDGAALRGFEVAGVDGVFFPLKGTSNAPRSC